MELIDDNDRQVLLGVLLYAYMRSTDSDRAKFTRLIGKIQGVDTRLFVERHEGQTKCLTDIDAVKQNV
jgi:hypothetical protein